MNFKHVLSLVLITCLTAPAFAGNKGRHLAADQIADEDLPKMIEEKVAQIEKAKEVLDKGERVGSSGAYRISGYATVATAIGAAGSLLATVHNHQKVKALLNDKETITQKGPGKTKEGVEKAGPAQQTKEVTPGLESRLKTVRGGLELETNRIMELLRGLEGTKDKNGKEISKAAVAKAWNHYFERASSKGKVEEEARLAKQIEGLKRGKTVRKVVTAGAVSAFVAMALVHASQKEETVELTEEEYAQYQVGVNVMEMELAMLRDALAQ